MQYKKQLIISGLVLLFSVGCTWVKLTPGGEKVRVLTQDEVVTCKKLGNTRAMLRDEIAGIDRKKEKVQKEMEALARNAAADMGGDTVVAVSEIEEGSLEARAEPREKGAVCSDPEQDQGG